ncbi:MAG: hypothetical protein ACJ74U_14825 [Jatrophihabitantaceae bacterium]
MTLNWLRQVQGVWVYADRGTYVPPKYLMLHASNMKQEPGRFEILQAHDSLIRRIFRRQRLPEFPPTNHFFDAIAAGNADYQGKFPWELPTHRRLLRKRTTHVFRVEGQSEISPMVYAARKGRVDVERSQDAGARVSIAAVNAGVGFERVAKGTVVWAVDPEMRLSVITGTELADHTIDVLRYATELDNDLRPRFGAGEQELTAMLRALFTGPSNWQLRYPQTVSGAEGTTSEFDLGLIAPSVGRGYFAIVLSDPNGSSEDDEIRPGFCLEVRQEGNELVLDVITDFTDMDMPDVALG